MRLLRVGDIVHWRGASWPEQLEEIIEVVGNEARGVYLNEDGTRKHESASFVPMYDYTLVNHEQEEWD